jgi:CRISPR/Cas system CSM-associated protein Csm2 small subunit
VQTIKDILNLIRQIVKAMTNLAEETEAWTEEMVTESKMARLEMANDRNRRLQELEALDKTKKSAKKSK